jgi:hypothetical protein
MIVVNIDDFRAPQPKQQSQYEDYPLPFFAAERHSTWTVKPTGDYAKDCETGRAYAVAFLESCDGTNGWSSLLQQIVADMVRAGPCGTFADGHPKVNGIVIGFMGAIGRALAQSLAAKSA